MVRVLQRGRIRVYVYQERAQRHHLPHGHAYWPDGSCVVSARTGEVLTGDDPPAAVRELVEEHLQDIERAWNRINPEG